MNYYLKFLVLVINSLHLINVIIYQRLLDKLTLLDIYFTFSTVKNYLTRKVPTLRHQRKFVYLSELSH